MSADLYYHPVSVPARAALLVVRNLELNVNVNILNIYTGEQNTPEYLKINPLHQVPCYVEKDFILTESKAIACYLANANPSKLYPADLKKRALVDSRLYFDATNCFPTIRDFARPVLRAGVKKIAPERRAAVTLLLNTLESFLEKSKWFAGDALTIADLAILASVSSIKAWGVSFVELPKLNDWYNRCKTLPGYTENEEGAQQFADTLTKLLEEPLWQ